MKIETLRNIADRNIDIVESTGDYDSRELIGFIHEGIFVYEPFWCEDMMVGVSPYDYYDKKSLDNMIEEYAERGND